MNRRRGHGALCEHRRQHRVTTVIQTHRLPARSNLNFRSSRFFAPLRAKSVKKIFRVQRFKVLQRILPILGNPARIFPSR